MGDMRKGQPQAEMRELKKERYRDREFVASYDSRYSGGLNALNTRVETAWVGRLATGLTLDCGAGTGRFSHPLAARGMTVIALDSSRQMLSQLRAKAPLPALAGDIYHLPLREGAFDSLVCLHLLFHLPDWPAALESVSRALRPGGRLLFEMRSGEHTALASRLLKLLGRTPRKADSGRSGATVHATQAQVRSALAACGLRLEATLNYDLGHAHYLSALSGALDTLFGKFTALRHGLAALELTAGKILPAAFTYRTLYCAVRQ
ncbi:class I SAM-dependent methyltransferase [bacterium]|nr:class I SAM-dependent methyltransferase [bacterium]